MSDHTEDRLFWREFIEIYKQHPCIWKVKSKEYSDRNMKNAAYETLVNKLKEKDENANRESVVKKINNLRSSFRKEHKKITSSYKSGAAAVDIYRPSLWYYDLLLFLHDQETSRPSVSNIEPEVCNKTICSVIIFHS